MDVRAPVTVVRSWTQTLDAPPDQILPLLCPVREAEWMSGWAPRLVLSRSGVAEPDCVFVAPDAAAGPGAEAVWTVLEQDPAGVVEMLKVTPGFTVIRLRIVLRPRAGGCFADVTYRYTALGPAGEAYVRSRTGEVYAEFMRGWEAQLNGWLARRPAAEATPA